MTELTTEKTAPKIGTAPTHPSSGHGRMTPPCEDDIRGLFITEYHERDPRCAILVQQIIHWHQAKNNSERQKLVDSIKVGKEWQRIAPTWDKFVRRALARGAFAKSDDNRAPERETVPEPVKNDGELKCVPSTGEASATKSIDATDVALADIDLDCAIQVREKYSQEVVDKYSELICDGVKLPPIKVFRVNGVLKVTDGAHRCKAAKKAGRETIQAIIVEGSEQDALKDALGANAQHGLPRSNKDKRRVAMLGIQNFGKLSDREIASICAISNTFVGQVRAELSTADSSSPRTGKDGKTRRPPTRKPKTDDRGEKSGDAQPSQPSSGREDGEGNGGEQPDTAPETPESENTPDTGDTNGPASAAEEPNVSRVDAVWQWLVPALGIRIKSLTAVEREELAVRLAVLADGLCSTQ